MTATWKEKGKADMRLLRKRCCWGILASVVFVSLAGVGVYLLIPPTPGVTRENFRRLHKGMTREKVLEVLGSSGQEEPPVFFPGPPGLQRALDDAFAGENFVYW